MDEQQTKVKTKLSTKAKVAIGVAVAVGFGVVIYFAYPGIVDVRCVGILCG
jgi:hypothetical protein